MLFPGAIIIISLILIIVGVCFSIAVGALFGIIVGHTADFFIHKTDLYKKRVRGEKGTYPWWISDKYWFFYGWAISTCVVAYTVAGPIWAFIQWLE